MEDNTPTFEEELNKHEKYMPVEFAYINYKNNWKKCACGKIVPFLDNWCGGCGQKLGIPAFDD